MITESRHVKCDVLECKYEETYTPPMAFPKGWLWLDCHEQDGRDFEDKHLCPAHAQQIIDLFTSH